MVLSEKAAFDVAVRLRSKQGAPLGEVFSFLSGLYFRGKLAYGRLFSRPPPGVPGVLVITPSAGLRPDHRPIRQEDLRRFAHVAIDKRNELYRRPFKRDARRLAAATGPNCEIVLLGSIATAKYTEILTEAFGDRVLVPAEFIGRGDMSRGGLLLRCVREQRELEYIRVTELTGDRRRGTGKQGAKGQEERSGRLSPVFGQVLENDREPTIGDRFRSCVEALGSSRRVSRSAPKQK
jgi:hypothetical protein